MKTSTWAFKKWNRQYKHSALLTIIMWLWFATELGLLMACNGDGKLAEFAQKRYSKVVNWPMPPSLVISLVLAIMFGIRANETEQARDDVRKVLQDQIVNALGIEPTVTDFKRAKKIGKYLWRYMTEEEKQRILNLYKKTSLYGDAKFDDDEEPMKEFVATTIEIAKNVVAREQNAQKTLTAIANGKTYMYQGWTNGHGGHQITK